MYNLYHALGRLILNLRNGRFLMDEEDFIIELADDFNIISEAFQNIWVEKPEGWEYLLDFHRSECERLRGFIAAWTDLASPIARAYMYERFTAQMGEMDVLIHGEPSG